MFIVRHLSIPRSYASNHSGESLRRNLAKRGETAFSRSLLPAFGMAHQV
jgi:hypothetical protein